MDGRCTPPYEIISFKTIDFFDDIARKFSWQNKVVTKLLIQQCQLEYLTVYKQLGFTFSNDLSWSSFINNIVNNR